MKRLIVLVAAMTMLVTGCGGSDLDTYQEAVLATQSYETGRTETRLEVDLTFNEDGLSFDEIRELSYFEEIMTRTRTTYSTKGDDRQVIVDGYFNFGGLGFDMIYYISGEEMLVKLPIMDKYLDIDMSSSVDGQTSVADVAYEAVIGLFFDTWNDVLMEEDVFSGKNAYVMTNKGQIKTTTYTLSINDDQFTDLKGAVLDILENEGVVEAVLADGNNFAAYDINAKEVQLYLGELLDGLELSVFEGIAYVDFDGRLVQQVFEAELVNKHVVPGAVAAMSIRYESNYDDLGQPVVIEMPEVSEEDMLNLEEDGSLKDYFPDGLFD